MTTYGIDLGTTYSCISRADDTGKPVVIRNTIGEESTPSVVFFESPYHVVIGREAKNAALSDPERVVSRIKREMGKPEVELDFHGVSYTPEGISAFILKDLVKSVEASTGETVKDVVITVPAYFGVAEREATRLAGEIAGLSVINVVAEPVAAALYYEVVNTGADGTILVFDLGGGTFDTTVIRLEGADTTVVCTDGDHELGGADWDDKIAAHLCERFMAEHPDSEAKDSEDFLQDVALVAEDIKKALTSRQSRRHIMQFNGRTARVELTRDIFESITAELLQRTMDITERTLEVARGFGVARFDEVLLVGGSTRMPAVATALRERFGFSPKVHEPDLAVAKGAALFAQMEALRLRLPDGASSPGAGGTSPPANGGADALNASADVVRTMAGKKVTIVVPRAFGVAVLDPEDETRKSFLVAHLLAANTALPAEQTQQFITADLDQREITVEIYEQAGVTVSEQPEHNKHIGEAIIRRLPPLPKGSPVDVTFHLDERGLLQVMAKELKTGQTATVDIKIGDLSQRQVAAAQDAVARLS